MQAQQREMGERLEVCSREVVAKEEQLRERDELIRELAAKLDEREAFAEQQQREDGQYLMRVQLDFQRQQKALQEAIEAQASRDQQIQQLREEVSLLQEARTVSRLREVRASPGQSVLRSPKESSEGSFTVVNCSINGTSERSQGLSQFEQIGAVVEEDSVEAFPREGEGEGEGQRGESIRQMLNLSYEKEFKLHFNKENDQGAWNRFEKSGSEDKRLCGVNRSLELLPVRRAVGEFKLAAAVKEDNPYYLYFQIASQNVKIRSSRFEEWSCVDAEEEWLRLNRERVPLHEWEEGIEAFLTRRAPSG